MVTALLALACRFALAPVLPSIGFPFLTFFPAVVLTALFAGLGPGLLASALSVAAAKHFFMPGGPGPLSFATAADAIALGFFSAVLLVDCVVIHVMTTSLDHARRERARADAQSAAREALAAELEARVGELRRREQDLGAALAETERSRAERAGGEARFRALAEAIPSLLFETDAEGRNIYVNPRFLEYTNLSPADMMGDGWLRVLHPDDRPRAAEAWAAAVRIGASYEVEYRFRRHDGAWRWFLGRGVPVRGGEGRIVRWVGTCTDIDDRKRTEAALAAAHEEARLSAERVQLALAAGAIVGTWMWDLTRDSFTVDERFAESFGLDPALGRSGLSLEQVVATVHPDDKAGLARAIDEAIVRGGPCSHEYRVRQRDGAYRRIEANGRVDHAPDGTPLRFPGVLLDVEAHRAAEAERDRANALLQTIIEAVPGVVYAKDRGGRFLVVNGGAAAVIGKRQEEIFGRTDADLLGDAAQAGAIMANDRRVMESGDAEQFEETVRLPDGTPSVWLSTKAPFKDAAGAIVGLAGSSVDITGRKRAEERLLLVVHELNHRVKNTLATVQSIASRTLRGADPAVRKALDARLVALASAHDVLTREGWAGADIDEVVWGVLAPHGGRRDGRFGVGGPAVRLRPRAAVALSMGLHELATNALKYGALSDAAAGRGRVEIRWEAAPAEGGPRFRLVWSERGGPPAPPPAKRGFGTQLVERSLAQDLGGTAALGFGPEGVTCTVEAPLAEVAAPAGAAPLPRVGRSGKVTE